MNKTGDMIIAAPEGDLGTLEVWSSGKITLSFPYTIMSTPPEAAVWALGDMDVEDISKFLIAEDEYQSNLFKTACPMLDKIAISYRNTENLDQVSLIMTANLNRPSSDFVPPYLANASIGWSGDELTITYFGYVDASLFKLNW